MFENMEPKKEKGVGNHKEINSLSNFIFEKISSNTLILLFNKDKEKIEPGEINKLLGESGELKFHVTENITEIRERRHVTAFSSNGFVLMLENKTQKIDSVRDPRAKYKLLNPDFISIEDGELDYDEGLRLLKEKSKTYQDSIEEEFFIKDNKETSWDFGKNTEKGKEGDGVNWDFGNRDIKNEEMEEEKPTETPTLEISAIETPKIETPEVNVSTIEEWTDEDEKTLSELLEIIENSKKELEKLDKLEEELNNKLLNLKKDIYPNEYKKKIEDARAQELEDPEITIEDYIKANPRLTEVGIKIAKEEKEDSIKKGKEMASLSFKYIENKISALEYITSHPYSYYIKLGEEEAKKYAEEESSYWKDLYKKINDKYDNLLKNQSNLIK